MILISLIVVKSPITPRSSLSISILNRGECWIPIQLQLASDADFLMASGDRELNLHNLGKLLLPIYLTPDPIYLL